MSEGLRERKKRQTRQRIHQVAMRLFVERGFDKVTIAEVAAESEVSVNTLYNYFEAKEDLVLPPDEASPGRLAEIVRERPSGASPARAVLERLREELRRREKKLGLTEGFGPVFEMMRAAPTLTARLGDLGGQMNDALAELLAEETGAGRDDPELCAAVSQIGWFHSLVFAEIGRRIVAGKTPDEIAADLLKLLDAVEQLLGGRAFTYAVRED
ncbi:TetR/AcrR family transcriptional regulator [Streptomyces sp. NBC_01795]|uniref:TetR/AcrR family transcriptional regulator n=1 Tax=unclassified Streptomyces TaxID=2593676 RepID=UPI002DD8B20E|nr:MULTISPECIES: helix-turn-helix domain-containing protein [unclassified Streptomyces]WSA96802.1 TetR/AcrR family transcriptional regulator [Streptomyces sp. NBC_01795]WSB81217.1 TetR/AcrR family transcriptional regulator [Streptomyces sp. NBC_01775]WSS10575.1 TetR/AcrR family transcriptional regulator [Streptomyces sp. NBC_01186]